MASPARPGLPARSNSRLDAFLRRHLPPEVYDSIRAYELCVVVSDSEKHAVKYVVLSDRLIYLTENPPKSIRRVVALRDIVAIDLIDDYPEFLSSPDRETNQHIRIIYYSTVLKRECEKSKDVRKFLFPFQHANANSKKVKEENSGPVFWRGKKSKSLNESFFRYHQESSTAPKDSTLSSPSDLKNLSLHGQSACRPLPTPSRRSCQLISTTSKAAHVSFCTANTKEPQGLSDHEDSLSERTFKCNGNRNEFHLGNSSLASPLQSNPNLEKKESELHLYIISTTSSIFLHLKSSWNNYVIKATLLQDPLYVSELSPAPGSQKPYRACIEIVQTLGLMFRETETESSRLNTLAAKKGTLFNLLVILISEPQIPKSCPVFDIQLVADSTLAEMSFDAELQKLILEYTDTATALLYEILLVFQQGNLGWGSTKFALSRMMSFLQSRPPIITFVASIVKQVVKGLSASFQLLSPGQAVLLYQQFYILKSCLQYSKTLAEYIRNDYREEFRYFLHMPALEKRLPLCYPITQSTTQLFHEVLKLVEQKQCVKC
ncbi:uncharacterized protein C12orf56 homolog isoform X4 [Hippopotamus amphibius kiboko]|uniref:uncharacterized protein C12orf56 homolog isoform X4 n=1 Tax=Hippopotamus amphibius kiboko TaxID=575201 RepID=UPI002592CFEA|nr:uncharacterized protein C12orf56 homolog isoform X4 [Hippopotamus amphibius kiboko]